MYTTVWGAVLIVGTLIASLKGAQVPENCKNVKITTPQESPSCIELAKYFKNNTSLERRSVSINGEAVRVALYWGSDPSRAAAALLRVIATHGLRYEGLQLACGPQSTTELAAHLNFSAYLAYDTLAIGVSTSWQEDSRVLNSWEPMQGMSCGLAGPRLEEFGQSPVAARCRLHGWLNATARHLPDCQKHVHWSFYTNTTAQEQCGFIDSMHNDIQVLVISECKVALTQLEARIRANKLSIQMKHVNRTSLLQHFRNKNSSFLFLDYDIWEDEGNVTIVEPPPCASVNFFCRQNLDYSIAMRIADVNLLERYAYHLLQFTYDFKPSPKSLRVILEEETTGVNIEEAACKWVLNNTHEVNDRSLTKYGKYSYWIAVYLCREDPDQSNYERILEKYIDKLPVRKKSFMSYNIIVKRFLHNCTNPEELNARIVMRKSFVDIANLVGIVAQVDVRVNMKSAVSAAASLHSPLLLLGEAPAADDAWRISGTPRHLTLALQRFVTESRWTRLAVLSQTDSFSDECLTALQDGAKFALGDFKIPQNFTKVQALESIQQMKSVDARIIFINADARAASLILSTALEKRMRYEDGYVWIVRDWQRDNVTYNITHFTASFWRRSGVGITNKTKLLYNKYSPYLLPKVWPPLTSSLVDALFVLSHSFYSLFTKHAQTRLDLQNDITKRLQNEFFKKPINGLTQVIQLKEGSIEETFVFLDKWRGSTFERLTTWKVNISADVTHSVRGDYIPPPDMPRNDGASSCLVKSGDPFEPTCHDTILFSVLMLMLLVPAAMLLAYRIVRRRVEKLVAMRALEQMKQRQQVANILSEYMVSRESLELREELGSGRFGRVRLALLRAPHAAPCFVAAKALREGAAPSEESEFLREARIIASLNHKHIVRLVGVCIDSGPPLVLMELAFFGDLLGYLRMRRHLVEGGILNEVDKVGPCEEAAHVSSEALTRLAREAATALAYMAEHGVIHRDFRAANCLVDARRSLKLADFGLARETKASAAGAAEYSCLRKGILPVMWVAPESLKYGVFSAASDVWALGVLILELVTLGARPYGNIALARVMQYVTDGGCPPLPHDASPQTRGVTQQCWNHNPELRPRAAEVASFLARNPRALRPALLTTPVHITEYTREAHGDTDSGLGESPSTELLPPGSPLDCYVSMQLDKNRGDANYFRSQSLTENQTFDDMANCRLLSSH